MKHYTQKNPPPKEMEGTGFLLKGTGCNYWADQMVYWEGKWDSSWQSLYGPIQMPEEVGDDQTEQSEAIEEAARLLAERVAANEKAIVGLRSEFESATHTGLEWKRSIAARLATVEAKAWPRMPGPIVGSGTITMRSREERGGPLIAAMRKAHEDTADSKLHFGPATPEPKPTKPEPDAVEKAIGAAERELQSIHLGLSNRRVRGTIDKLVSAVRTADAEGAQEFWVNRYAACWGDGHNTEAEARKRADPGVISRLHLRLIKEMPA